MLVQCVENIISMLICAAVSVRLTPVPKDECPKIDCYVRNAPTEVSIGIGRPDTDTDVRSLSDRERGTSFQ
jgi:hypothetical protein